MLRSCSRSREYSQVGAVGALKTKKSTTMTRRICWIKALLGGDANDIVVFTTLVDESAGDGFLLSVPGIFSFFFYD